MTPAMTRHWQNGHDYHKLQDTCTLINVLKKEHAIIIKAAVYDKSSRRHDETAGVDGPGGVCGCTGEARFWLG